MKKMTGWFTLPARVLYSAAVGDVDLARFVGRWMIANRCRWDPVTQLRLVCICKTILTLAWLAYLGGVYFGAISFHVGQVMSVIMVSWAFLIAVSFFAPRRFLNAIRFAEQSGRWNSSGSLGFGAISLNGVMVGLKRLATHIDELGRIPWKKKKRDRMFAGWKVLHRDLSIIMPNLPQEYESYFPAKDSEGS